MRTFNGVKGTVLIELMISALIGVVLIGSMCQIYLTSQESFRLQSSLNQLQENAKTAINILSTEIRMAGYIGCAKLTEDFPVVSYQHYSITPQNKLIITNDAITVRHAGITNVELINPTQNLSVLLVANNVKFKKNQVLIISDCKNAEIFQVKSVSISNRIQKIVAMAPLHNLFDEHAEISHFEINHIYATYSTLYLENIHRSKIRLVDGIDSMQIRSVREIKLNVSSQLLHKEWYAYVSV